MVYISSGGSVYGMQPYRATELSNPSPISAYGLSKYTVENYLRLYHHNFNLSYDILRLSNVYGVGQRSTKPQGVISAIAQAFLRKESFKIWGDGTAKKDYLYIDDLTEALIRVLSKEASNDTFNIAAGVSYSLNEVVSLLESNFGHSIKLEKANPYDFDVQTVLIDNSKFVKEYEWSPHVCIETGIARAVDWFKSSEE